MQLKPHAAMTVWALTAACTMSFAPPLLAHDSEEEHAAAQATPRDPGDEAILFTPPGFNRPGQPKQLVDGPRATLRLTIRDSATGRPTPCRVNVVGPDGQFYQPQANRLSPFDMTGEWPKTGKGNRAGKAPIRYHGRFFYTTGETTIAVPPGTVRVEAFKGFEFAPVSATIDLKVDMDQSLTLSLTRTLDMNAQGYQGGDPHIHIARKTEEDDQLIFDLMEAEDIRYPSLLAYNEPAGPYTGFMDRMDSPQFAGLGKASVRSRGDIQLVSGQEYRSGTYGHLNLFLNNDLVLKGQSVNANNWPLYGLLGRQTQNNGGVAVYAHGGYAQAIYSDFAKGDVNAVELLQFGVYRGIELEDWYRILNIGYKFPAVGACDYPACRFLGDSRTYVQRRGDSDVVDWFKGLARGASFITSGPMLMLEVDGKPPGSILSKTGKGQQTVKLKIRVRCDVTPVTNLHVIVNGQIVGRREIPADHAIGRWFQHEQILTLEKPSWIAARAFSVAPNGSPNAEAHANPIYVHLDGKAPYLQADLDALVVKLDGQMALHRKRDFPEKSQVLDDFQKSRDILLKIREQHGLPAPGAPEAIPRPTAPELPDPGARTHSDEELRAFLKPLPAKTPSEAAAMFETARGFQMELVAAEPLVASPVAATFDENGQLYVAEMRDYPYKPRPGQKPLGTIRLLRDTDGDGRFDQSTIFADGLLWPAGVACWKGGVFVAAPPDIWFLKDFNGDHIADSRQKIFTGFGLQNQQGMLNNLIFGLDHKLYGSSSINGGDVQRADQPQSSAVSVRGRDFRFNPVSLEFEAITGAVQFGNTFDDWGNRFLCSESHPLLHPLLPAHALARNPFLAVSSAIDDIVGGSVPIFRISPIERWRQIRSSRRIAHGERSADSAGASHHVIDAAAGVTVYRGGAYPETMRGQLFVADAQNNLIHRRTLVPNGLTFRSERVDANAEFVRSSDTWFRPVNFLNAPDGTLFVLDMSREVLESIHIPDDVVKYLDLRRGREQGRIYRIALEGQQSAAFPRLGDSSTPSLVQYLTSDHGWIRDTAHRLLYERQDESAVEPLRRLLASAHSAQARIHALWSLQGLDSLTTADLKTAMDDRAESVREHAIELGAARAVTEPAVGEAILARATDGAVRVRFQVALALGEMPRHQRTVETLARLLREDGADPWFRAGALSSCSHNPDQVLASLIEDAHWTATPTGRSIVEALARTVGARGRQDEIERILGLESRKDPESPILHGAIAGLGMTGKRLPDLPLLKPRIEQASLRARDTQASDALRVQAIQLLARLAWDRSRAMLVELLDPNQPQAVQEAVVLALASDRDPEIARVLLARFAALGPRARAVVVQSLLARPEWTRLLLAAASEHRELLATLDSTRRDSLRRHSDSRIAQEANKLLGAGGTSTARGDLVRKYAAALERAGDPSKGRAVFQRECSSCHKIGDLGQAVGPDLASSPSRDPAALLMNILDPNQYVQPNYTVYVLDLTDGRVAEGMIAADTPTSLVLRRSGGEQEMLLRGMIESMKGTGRSLMPEGLEARIAVGEMTDLIAFLMTSAGAASSATPRAKLGIGTLPGLIEPDR